MIDGEALPAGIDEAVGIEAELVHQRGLNVGEVMAILNGVETEFVGGAVDDAPP
jgi:hypothetical protein